MADDDWSANRKRLRIDDSADDEFRADAGNVADGQRDSGTFGAHGYTSAAASGLPAWSFADSTGGPTSGQ